MRRARRGGARIALGVAGAIALVLVLAQLLLPILAARRVRGELARYGVVHSASISAFPAIELLWGEAQSASVSAGPLSVDPAQLSELLWQARGVQRIDLHADSMRVGSLALSGVSVRKRGDRLDIAGHLSEAQLRASLPGSTGFQLLGSGAGGARMRVEGSLLGVSTSLEVLIGPARGKLVAEPRGTPLGSLLKVTLLSAPHLYIQSFAMAASVEGSGAAVGAGAERAYRVRIGAQLR